MKGIYVVVPLWGEHYVRRWLEFSLASLLAEGNLPALARDHKVRVLLFTTREDLQLILPSPAVKALRDVCGLRVLPFAESAAEARQKSTNVVMTTLHNEGLRQAWADDHGVVFLVADSLYADGSFRFVNRMIAAGKRAVLTQGVNAVQTDAEALVARRAVRSGPVLTLPPRALARIVLETLHWSCRLQFWDTPNFSSHPALMYWSLGGRGLLMRGWHLYPLFLHPDRPAQARTTIDNDFIDTALAGPDDCALVGDSDDGLFLDMIDPGRRAFHPSVPFPANPAFVAAWCRHWTTPFTRALIRRHKFRIHDGVDGAEWREVEAASDCAVDEILALYERGAAMAAGGTRYPETVTMPLAPS